MAYMREHLVPVIQPMLANEGRPCAVYYNVVSNVKLDPSEPLPLLSMTYKYPNSEIKSGFGAVIMRFIRTMSKEQHKVPLLKPSAVTHLVFANGALGSTGNRSEEEARLGCHECRMSLYASLGIRTNFRRFTVPNRVCSASLGHGVDLPRMSADDQVSRHYHPDLFPGLFFRYKHVYPERQAFYREAASGRKVQLLEEDLAQLQKPTNAVPERRRVEGASADSVALNEEETKRSEMKELLDKYLPRSKNIMVLVFSSGRMVVLGSDEEHVGTSAFDYVAEVAKDYAVEFKKPGPGGKTRQKRMAQVKVEEKREAIKRLRVNYANPFSKETRIRIQEVTETVEDEIERKNRIKEILTEEKTSRKKRKKRSSEEDDMEDLAEGAGMDDDELEEFALQVEGSMDTVTEGGEKKNPDQGPSVVVVGVEAPADDGPRKRSKILADGVMDDLLESVENMVPRRDVVQ